MPLFGRRRGTDEAPLPITNAPGPVDNRPSADTSATATNTVTHGHGHGRRRRFGSRAPAEPYSMSTRPSFGQWLKGTWRDILTMVIMGALGLGIYFAEPRPSRSFAVTFSDGQIVYPQFAYPLRDEVVPIWLAAFLASMVPICFILLMQIRVRSFWDANNAVIGLLYSLITAAVFQVWVKWLIGGLRPHFLEVCDPDPARIGAGPGEGFGSLYFRPDICRGDKKLINDALESFPSGHTTAAFAGFGYLYLYLNAKLKVFSNYHPSMWKLVLLYSPILAAVLIGGALTIDEYHNWYDIFAGAAVGIVMAFSSYRMTYAAVWDWRFNHIPLNRNAPFDYHGFGAGAMPELCQAVAARKAGWGGTAHHGGFRGEKDAAAAMDGGRHAPGHGHGHHHGVPGHHGHNTVNHGPVDPVAGESTSMPNSGFTQPRRPVAGVPGAVPEHMV